MPNWCSNVIVIRGDKDIIKTILDKIGELKGDTECKLFETLIGTDPELGTIGWYESNLKRFGTKWDVSAGESNIEFCDDKITMTPQTAWSPPVYFCETLSKEYGVEVSVQYYEPGCDFSGRVIFDNGEVSEEDNFAYYEGLFHMDNESFWTEMDDYYFPLDTEKTPEEYVKENFYYLNATDREKVVEMYKEYILDQESEDDDGD